jgi:hypothetical protein
MWKDVNLHLQFLAFIARSSMVMLPLKETAIRRCLGYPAKNPLIEKGENSSTRSMRPAKYRKARKASSNIFYSITCWCY